MSAVDAGGMDEVTQYIVIRRDVAMSKGKVAAQAAHAAVNAVVATLAHGSDDERRWLHTWFNASHAKVVLKADDGEFQIVLGELRSRGATFEVVVDEGRTQIEPGTTTALALAPMPRSVAANLVSWLPLL